MKTIEINVEGKRKSFIRNRVGEVFTKLTIVAYSRPAKRSHYWVCKCECGSVISVVANNLISGHTKSCGCLQIIGKETHGQAYNKLYATWHSMWQRCTNPKNKRYYCYGARGIRVCGRWKDVNLFLKDIGPRPKGYSLDRIDNNGNYEQKNCRWATPIQQASNKTTNVQLTYKGVTDTLSGWSRKLGFKTGILQRRYVQLGWSIKETLTIKPRKKVLLKYKGRSMTLTQWATVLGMSINTLTTRYYTLKWSIEKTLTTPVRSR